MGREEQRENGEGGLRLYEMIQYSKISDRRRDETKQNGKKKSETFLSFLFFFFFLFRFFFLSLFLSCFA